VETKKKISEANVRWCFTAVRRRPVTFASSEERDARAFPQRRDRLFINANTSSNWRGATGTVKYLNTKYLKWVASRFQSLSWSKLPRNATLFDSM